LNLTLEELARRKEDFCRRMDSEFPDWSNALIVGKVNQYYFAGSMQNALLIITRDGGIFYFVRESYDRARKESPLDCIYPMRSYRDAAEVVGAELGNIYVEADIIPHSYVERLRKSFSIDKIGALDSLVKYQRAVKSEYEMFYMEDCCRRSGKVLSEIVPTLLYEGMWESNLHHLVSGQIIKHGHAGVVRFGAFQCELLMGQITFGADSLFPNDFDGPTGSLGNGAYAPLFPSSERALKKGDLVLVDISVCRAGYNSDVTRLYSFGAKPAPEVLKLHRQCTDIQRRIADALRPGAIPSKIYGDVMDTLSPDLVRNFMGFGARRARFVGHGIGLTVDEYPVLARGFDKPLEENMTLAIEPKVGIENIGVVGFEDTYAVTPYGGRCLTGDGESFDIIVVD